MITINKLTYEEIEEYDIFNYKNTYYKENFSDPEYNCMAYAFGAYTWLEPLNFDEETIDSILDELENLIFKIKHNKRIYANLVKSYNNYNYTNHFIRKIMINRMLSVFPELRIIKTFDELKNDEYGISFATGIDDYHFIKFDNGVYSHKQGSNKIEIINNEKKGFGKQYFSKIIRFAMKKGKIEFNQLF